MLIVGVVGALSAPAVAHAQNPVLRASVGPGPVITLRDAAGAPVTRIAPGTYDVVVSDLGDEHNFHLRGPGVDQATDVPAVENVTWVVTFADGVYRFFCDPHAATMRGVFAVGTAVIPPPPPPPPPPASGGGGTRTLVATVGPGFSITLTRNGRRVRSLAAGRYRITVRDRSPMHNFHLIGRGVNRKTAVRSRGNRTWTVTFRRGTYRFVCDPHARAMRGSFRVT